MSIQVTVTVNHAIDASTWWAAVSQAPRAVPAELRPLFAAGTPVVLDLAAAGRALDWAASLPGWAPAADETYPLRFLWSGEATPAQAEVTRLRFALYRAEAEVESLRAELAALRAAAPPPAPRPGFFARLFGGRS
jgi:hypothetical protein